jgi:hypothetical protein
MGLDFFAQPLAPLEPVPERLRRHAEDEIIRLAGHHLVDRGHHGAADIDHELVEIVVVANGVVGDVDAAEMIGDAGRPHGVVFGLHRRVGRRRHHAELFAIAQGIRHSHPHAALTRTASRF